MYPIQGMLTLGGGTNHLCGVIPPSAEDGKIPGKMMFLSSV